MKIGSPLFHVGLLAVIGGHVLGILVPKVVTDTAGVSEEMYHVVSVGAGTSAGVAMTIGFAILLYRRLRIPRVRHTTTRADRATYLLLGLVVATGMWATIGVNLLGGGYDYRETVGPWFRGLFMLNPQPELMSGAPLIYQLHALAAFSLFALWPFSRLVHAWSAPVAYLRRSPILYRTRGGPINRPPATNPIPRADPGRRRTTGRQRISSAPQGDRTMSSNDGATTTTAPGPAGSGRNLALATAAFALCFSAWGMLAPLAPKIQDKLDLSNTETAIMIAIPVVLGSLLRIPLGWLTDRRGGRVMFTAILAYTAGAALLLGFTTSYGALLAAGFLLGVAGSSFAVGVPFVAEWYPQKRQGFALGVYGAGNIGTAVAAFSVPYLYTHYGQATAGIVFAAAIGAFTLIWASTAQDAPVTKHARPRYREVLRSGWGLWQLAFFYFVTFGGFVAMAIFLPKLLVDWFDFSLTSAGLRAAGFTVVATLARPIGGWLSDRLDASTVLTLAFIGIGFDAVALSWQATDPAIVPVTIFCLTMAGFLGIGNGAVFKLVPQQFPGVDRCRDRHRRCGGRAGWVLPATGPRPRQGRDRHLHDGVRLPRRLCLDVCRAWPFQCARRGRRPRRPPRQLRPRDPVGPALTPGAESLSAGH